MKSENYAYTNIMRAYRLALEKAAEKIGLDSHTKTLHTTSLDSKIINKEISNIYFAGRTFVNEAFVRHGTQDNDTGLDEIKRYVESMEKPAPINKYYNDDSTCKDPKDLYLSADVVLSDLHNAFNHGIYQNYNMLVLESRSDSMYNIYFGNKKVKINFKVLKI